MGQVSSKMRSAALGDGESALSFWCPGCKGPHMLRIGGDKRPQWEWNGDVDRPTFDPSVMVRSGHFVPGQEGKECWCSYEQRFGRKLPEGTGCSICHSFVRDGRIEFLSDSTHALAGVTMDLPDWPGAE